MNTVGGNVGYVGGALATAPLAPAASGIKGAAATGAAFGAAQPATSWDERGLNTLAGAGASAGGQALVNGVARIVRPQTSAAAQTLLDSGITPTPGQILGGGYKRAEEAATSIPVVGDFIKSAQNRGIGQLNHHAAIGHFRQRAAQPVGASQRLERARRR